jgi:UDP-N-acetylglucosamine 4,6-dehydratase
MKVLDMAQAVAPDCQIESVGIRPGEKLHEVLISEDEARHALQLPDMFILQPAHSWWQKANWANANPVPEGFRYGSDTNTRWLTASDLFQMLEGIAPAEESPGARAQV